jgi:hypothetical protein
MAANMEESQWAAAELIENAVNKQDCIARLQVTVSQLHKCGANHGETVPVEEPFDLYGHPETKVCYGRSHRDGTDDTGTGFVTVLQIPPVFSPETAVEVAIVAEVKEKI